jgi:hypothetical protein
MSLHKLLQDRTGLALLSHSYSRELHASDISMGWR